MYMNWQNILSTEFLTAVPMTTDIEERYLCTDILSFKPNTTTAIDSRLDPIKVYYPIDPYNITRFEVVVPSRVLKVYFDDGKSIKVVCHQQDEFSLKRGLFIALSKKKYGKTHTVRGIEYMAEQLSYLKEYDKIVDNAIKAHEKDERLKMQKLADERRASMARANKKHKHEAYLKRRDEKRRQAKIDEIAEAIKRANN